MIINKKINKKLILKYEKIKFINKIIFKHIILIQNVYL